MAFIVELLDAEGRQIERNVAETPDECELVLRNIGANLVAFDDVRFDGPGTFQGGTLRWYKED